MASAFDDARVSGFDWVTACRTYFSYYKLSHESSFISVDRPLLSWSANRTRLVVLRVITDTAGIDAGLNRFAVPNHFFGIRIKFRSSSLRSPPKSKFSVLASSASVAKTSADLL